MSIARLASFQQIQAIQGPGHGIQESACRQITNLRQVAIGFHLVVLCKPEVNCAVAFVTKFVQKADILLTAGRLDSLPGDVWQEADLTYETHVRHDTISDTLRAQTTH